MASRAIDAAKSVRRVKISLPGINLYMYQRIAKKQVFWGVLVKKFKKKEKIQIFLDISP